MAWIEHLIRGAFCLWFGFFFHADSLWYLSKNGVSSQKSMTGGKAAQQSVLEILATGHYEC